MGFLSGKFISTGRVPNRSLKKSEVVFKIATEFEF